MVNPLNAELNPICHFLALLGAHYILHVSRIRVKCSHTCLVMYAQTNVGLLFCVGSGSNVAVALAVVFHEIFHSVQV
jgi:hypothetical protein